MTQINIFLIHSYSQESEEDAQQKMILWLDWESQQKCQIRLVFLIFLFGLFIRFAHISFIVIYYSNIIYHDMLDSFRYYNIIKQFKFLG